MMLEKKGMAWCHRKSGYGKDYLLWSGLAQLVAHHTLGRGVPHSILVRGVVSCGFDFEQVTFPKFNLYICIICAAIKALQSLC